MSICKDCLHNEVCKYGENRSNGMYCTGEKCKQYKPTADVVEVRKGRWKGAGMGDYYCSLCCNTYSGGDEFNYCPNCGAKMDGERREDTDGT